MKCHTNVNSILPTENHITFRIVCSNKNSLAVSHDYRDRQTGHVDFRIIGSRSFVTYKFSSYCELTDKPISLL
jgi:hypothetical protein